MANRCPSCGGTLRFDIQKQKLVCEYCMSEFDASSMPQMGGADESEAFGQETAHEEGGDTIDAKIFTCPNCGAEVFATDLDAVEYCSYCGTFVTLESRLAKLQKPSYILPFAVTKEKCMELYKEKLKAARFLPKDMSAEGAENSFRRIYIPFWAYEVDINADKQISADTYEKWTRGNTEYTQHYTIKANADGKLDNIFFDASATLDDRISEEIGNFPMDSLQSYNSSIMAGSYADVADVSKDTYADKAYDKGLDTLMGEVRSNLAQSGGRGMSGSSVRSVGGLSDFSLPGKTRKDYGQTTAKLAMLPVWFMTYKNKNRLCYAVVNGSTGKMFAEIPADLKKYTISSIILAIPIFFLLELFLTLMPRTMLTVTGILSLIILISYWYVSSKLKKQENRTNDLGFQKVFKKQAESSGGNSFGRGALVSILSLIAAAILTAMDMPNDLLYYGCSLLCTAGSFIAIASMVKAHNLCCSRPIPHFFEKRKEAGK